MKLLVLYHPQSEHSRVIEEFTHDFTRKMPDKKMDLLSLETREGSDMARTYGIVQYPAILALRDDGQVLKHWEGAMMPLMNEVASYAYS